MRAVRVAIAASMAILVAIASAPAAFADSLIVASDPKPHAELSARPGWVTLVFKREVDVSLAKILVLGSSGENVAVGPLIVEGTNVTTQLTSELKQDTFTVMYRIDRSDGQPQGGAFQFAYGRGDWASVPASSWSGQDEEPDVMRNPNPKATTTATAPSAEPSTASPSSEPTGIQTSAGMPTSGVSPTTQGGQTPSGWSSPLGWVIGIGVFVVAAAAVVWVLWKRRNV